MTATTLTPVAPATQAPERGVSALFRFGATMLVLSSILSGTSVGNLFFVAGLATAVAALIIRQRVDSFIIWPAAFLLLILASAVAVGSLPNTDSFGNFRARAPEFVTAEGRIFLSFASLLLAAVCRPADRSIAYLVRLFRMVAWLGIAMSTVGQLPPLRGVLYTPRENLLFGLSSSHHVTGFLFGTTAIILLTTYHGKRRSNIWLGVATIGTVVLTGSRTTIIGFAVAGLFALFMRASSHLSGRALRRFRIVTVIGLLLLIPLQGALRLPIFDPETISAGIENLEERDPLLDGATYDFRTANTLKRFALWGDGYRLVQTSPFVGIGAFRFNDDAKKQTGIAGLALVTTEGKRNHSATTAHNAYLHITVELGILGLALLMAIWLGLGRRLNRVRRSPTSDDLMRSDAESALLLLAFAFGTALTSSSLFTPGLCIPVLLYIGSIALRGDLDRQPEVEPQAAT